MVIVKSGAKCSCADDVEKCRCEGCGGVFCFRCQIAYLVSPGFVGSNEKKRCCPECHNTSFVYLTEKTIESLDSLFSARAGVFCKGSGSSF